MFYFDDSLIMNNFRCFYHEAYLEGVFKPNMKLFSFRMEDVKGRELLRVIEQFSWIADITMMDYFVDDVWQKLPSSWREFLKDMQVQQFFSR